MKCKSNKNLEFIKDDKKSYVYIHDKGKYIGLLRWHYNKKEWVYENGQIKRKGD